MAYTTINDPSAHFQIALWTGNSSSTQAITNTGNSNLQPDWVWLKRRSDTENHTLADTSRGITKRLVSNNDAAENAADGVVSVQSDGFTVGGGYNGNTNGATYVGWQWKANGGTTSSNSDGSITSTVQANTTAGFSIVTYTGTGSNATVGHGLNSAPQIVLLKGRSNSGDWQMYNTNLSGTNKTISINTSDAANTESSPYYSFNNTAPTSTVFSLGSGNTTNGSSRTFVAYCFHSVKGYSKIGSYTGNNDADGPFIYTGFKPAWLLIKNYTSSGNGWTLTDSTRSPVNEATKYLLANSSDSEGTGVKIDLLSNGFKLRATSQNESQSYIYMAFAASPFVSSAGVPTTAF